jgi:hypothetical protein
MRLLWSSLAVAALLAGCSADPSASAGAATGSTSLPPAEGAGEVVLSEGTFLWHADDAPAGQAYKTAIHPLVHVCMSFDTRSPHYTNLDLPLTDGAGNLAPAAGVLGIRLAWGDADFQGDSLRLAYKAAGNDAYELTGDVARDTHVDWPVVLQPEPGDSGWDLWLCLPDGDKAPGDPGWQPWSVTGSITVRITFRPM